MLKYIRKGNNGKMFLAKITVKLKKNVKNPETQTLETLLRRLNFAEVKKIAFAKVYEIKIDAKNKAEAQKIAAEIAEKTLYNPIIEEFEVIILHE